MKRLNILLLVAVMIMVTALTACSSKKDSNNSVNNSNHSTEGQATLNIVNGKLDPPASFTTIMYENSSLKFKDGENITENVHIRWAKEALGVEIKTLWTGGLTDGTFDTKLKLMLASGDEIPDVISALSPQTVHLLIESGKFMDVEEAFEKYASPTTKAAFAEDPSIWDFVTVDGKKMALPQVQADFGHAENVLWIRQDWLDKLKLEAPTTIEELEAVMDAFANQDPDGNGQKDTYALELALKDKITGHTLGDSSWVFGLFGAIPERWYPGENGKLQYGSVQPGIKDALLKLKEWKDKGYIASDVAIHEANTIVPSVAANKVGIIAAPNYFMLYPGSLLLASVPDAMYIPYPLPEGVNGSNMRTTFSTQGAFLINKDISEQALQAFFHYRNSLYEVYNSEDSLFFRGFQEGYDYIVEDGKPVVTEDTTPTTDYVLGSPPVFSQKVEDIYVKLVNKEPLTEQEKGLRVALAIPDDASPLYRLMYDAIGVALSQRDANVKQHYVGPTTSTMQSRQELLQKSQMEAYTKIIHGEAGIEAFDKYVEQYYFMGGTKITEEVNEWYEALRK